MSNIILEVAMMTRQGESTTTKLVCRDQEDADRQADYYANLGYSVSQEHTEALDDSNYTDAGFDGSEHTVLVDIG